MQADQAKEVKAVSEAAATRKKSYFRALRGEFKKIVWPNFSTLMKQSGTVISVALALGLVIYLIDTVYSLIVVQLLSL